jgi:DNA-binding CsgD family transcriptional regulator
MSRKSTPVHLRKSGPGTGGRNWERDKEICALKATGLSNEAVGKRFNLSRETVRHVLAKAARDAAAGRTRWMSVAERRAESARERAGS